MTDKTVKNGVDISKCEYVTADGFCNHTLSGSCVKDKCQIYRLFKQLQRKTAECEELKKASFVLAEGLNFRQKILDEIEMICEAQDFKVDWTALEILDIIKRTGGRG